VANERGSTAKARTTEPLRSPDFPVADELTKVLNAVESAESFHRSWVDKVEKRYRAYRGIAEKRKENVPAWRSKLTTPYLLQIAEGMLATMMDPKPTWEVKPKPLPGEPIDAVNDRMKKSKIASAGLQWAMDEDDFPLKQRPFMQQDMIVGASLAKVVWAYETKDATRLVPMNFEVTDDWGQIIDRYIGTEEVERTDVIRDGPSMIVRDLRDFFWPEGAKDIPSAAWVIDRSWETWETLKAKQDSGLYKNVDLLKEARNNQAQQDFTDREQMLWAQQRNKDLIEVLEYWENGHVITVGGRTAVLASQFDPLRIKAKPFVMTSSMPDAFQFVGMSVIEALAQIQEYLWTLQNQRIDALRLLTNVITTIRSDVDDPDAFEWYPGAQWIVEDPGQVGQLQIDGTAAQITLEAESLLKGDLQNMLGGLPMAGGVSSGSIDQKTATGMSIITSIAQKLIQARKQHYMWAYSKIGQFFLGMMGQMIRQERVIPQMGQDGSHQMMVMHPLDLQGEFNVNVDVSDESIVKQERVQEAMAFVNMVAPIAPMAGINMQEVVKRVLESQGVTDTERYFTPPPQQGVFAGQQGGGQNAQGTPPTLQNSFPPQLQPPGQGSQGMTNPALATQMGGNNGMNMSPDQFAQSQVQAAQQLGG
jgi:hypothetical protein